MPTRFTHLLLLVCALLTLGGGCRRRDAQDSGEQQPEGRSERQNERRIAPPPWLARVLIEGQQTRSTRASRDTGLRWLEEGPVEEVNEAVRRRSRRAETLLREKLAHPVTAWWRFLLPPGPTSRVGIDREVLLQDRQRILNFLAERGFFDASVSFALRSVSPSFGSARVREQLAQNRSEAVYTVVEGPRSRISRIDITGLAGLPEPLRTSLQEQINEFVPGTWDQQANLTRLTAGTGEDEAFPRTGFELALYEQLKRLLQNNLRDQRYARAEVEGRADAWPAEEHVTLDFRVTTGEPCDFGEIVFEGLEKMQSEFLLTRIDLREGDPYSAAQLRAAQATLFGLGVFSSVTVVPDLTGEGSSIPIRIQLQETRPRTVEWGFGLTFEPGLWSVTTGISYEHRNLFQRLINFRVALEGGVAISPSFEQIEIDRDGDGQCDLDRNGECRTRARLFVAGDRDENGDLQPPAWGPLGKLDVEIGVPLPRRLFARAGASMELGLEPGYRFFHPGLSIGLGWRPTRALSLDFSYHLEYWDYFPDEVLPEDLFGDGSGVVTEFVDPYLLSYLQQVVTLDLRDDKIDTSRGFLGSLTLQEAGLGGVYRYFRVQGDLRGYAPILPSIVTLAGRLRGGIVAPIGNSPGVPLAHRFFTGGAYDVRGWRSQSLPAPGGTTDPTAIQIGGNVLFMASAELRVRPIRLVSVAAFFDIGRVFEDAASFDMGALYPTVGGGLRLHTPVGPIRLDVAYRLRQSFDITDDRTSRWQVHIAINEAF